MAGEEKMVMGVMMAVMMMSIMQSFLQPIVPEPEPTPEPEPGAGATIKLEFKDSEGNVIAPESPLSLDPGSSGTLTVTVGNQSTRGGEPWAATLSIVASMLITGGVQLLGAQQTDSYGFAAGESHQFGPYSWSVPGGTAGYTGVADALVMSPAGVPIASASEAISINLPVWSAFAVVSVPSAIYEGTTFEFTVAVTNACTLNGAGVPASLSILVQAIAAGVHLCRTTVASAFSPGETKTWTFVGVVPWDLGGAAGVIDAVIDITSPTTGIIGSGSKDISIIAVPIDYRAWIGF